MVELVPELVRAPQHFPDLTEDHDVPLKVALTTPPGSLAGFAKLEYALRASFETTNV